MQQLVRLIVTALGVALVFNAVAAENAKEHEDKSEQVALTDLPAPARAAVEKWLGDGKIKKIDKEIEDGKVVYDVEATKDGKHVETTVAENATVMSVEEEVAFDALPKPVREAAEKYFGGSKGLQASKEIEGGKTAYEVEGKKGDAKMALKLDVTGKILEEEKE